MNFLQTLEVVDCNDIPRIQLYKELCENLNILHIGCVDWPFVPEHNLHIALQDVATFCDGYDLNMERYPLLDPYLKNDSELWVNFPSKEITATKYDITLVPEVIEHVPNVGQFFDQLKTIDTAHYVITVPCAVQCGRRGHFHLEGETYTEEVHPEHVAWYTPYTLVNTIKQHTDWKIKKVFWNNGISVGVVCQK